MAQPVIYAPLYDSTYPARNVAYTSAAGSTAPYPAGPQAVAVMCSTAAYVVVGDGAVATSTNGIPIPANQLVTIAVPEGTGAPWKVSAVAVAADGTIYVKPVNKEGI